MEYAPNVVENTLKQAAKNLSNKQPNLYLFTDATTNTEWNLCHHLSVEIHELFPELDYDLDVIKPGFGRKRPDIIFHLREEKGFEANILVVEAKLNGSTRALQNEVNKILDNWFQPPLSYQFGAVINFVTNQLPEIIFMRNNNI